MKKQYKTYILIIAVLIVWGIIGVQIFSYLNPKEEEELPSLVSEQKSFRKETKIRESYKVKTHQRDPFLGKIIIKPITIKKTKKKPVEPVVFPSIIYHGIIESGKNKSFIISVNGVQNVLKVGQTMQEIRLLSGDKKQINIRYKGNTKVVTLN